MSVSSFSIVSIVALSALVSVAIAQGGRIVVILTLLKQTCESLSLEFNSWEKVDQRNRSLLRSIHQLFILSLVWDREKKQNWQLLGVLRLYNQHHQLL